MGKFIAKAVLDNRMVDLPFSLPFYQWLLREESTLTSQDLRNIDPTIASTISQLEGKNLSIKYTTGSPLIVRFLGPRKNRTNGNPYY